MLPENMPPWNTEYFKQKESEEKVDVKKFSLTFSHPPPLKHGKNSVLVHTTRAELQRIMSKVTFKENVSLL